MFHILRWNKWYKSCRFRKYTLQSQCVHPFANVIDFKIEQRVQKWRESDGPLFSVIQNSGLRKNKTKVKYPGNFQCTPWGQVPVVCTSADSSRERFSASFSGLVHKGHTVVCWTTQWEPWRTFSFSPWQSPLSLRLMWSISFKDWPNLKVTQHR